MKTTSNHLEPTRDVFSRSLPRRRFLEQILVLLGATGCGSTKALMSQVRPSPSERAGERMCVSLRVLTKLAETNQKEGKQVPNEVAALGGMSRIEGYICDHEGQDLILIGNKALAYPSLHLDDVAVSLASIWQGEAPYCSLDPRKQDVLAVNDLMRSAGQVTDLDQIRAVYRRLREIWGPQTVVVGGVPRFSRHAHVMIVADNAMKMASESLVTLPGIVSNLDRFLVEAEQSIRQGRMPAMRASMARFWFHLAENHPNFIVNDGIVCLKDCSVVVLTEQQRATADGALFDSGEEDSLARGFAEEFSAAFPRLVTRVPVYAALENLYRLSALFRVMNLQSAPQRAGLDLRFLMQDYRLLDPKPMPPSLPGMVNGKEKQFTIRQGHNVGELFLHPMVCGGVGMDMRVTSANLSRDTTLTLSRLRLAAIKARPHGESFCWSIAD